MRSLPGMRSFGESSLHNCEVMLEDLSNSKRLDSHVHSESGKATYRMESEPVMLKDLSDSKRLDSYVHSESGKATLDGGEATLDGVAVDGWYLFKADWKGLSDSKRLDSYVHSESGRATLSW
ncbi:hypothetical protein T484DRAFT_1844560 [Baffinella frigidus]|nr:hypothetical protein T484DRAFT_1844560 [Cryptophyta sp. CCMP2293]